MSRISHFQNVLTWQWQLMIPQMCGPVWGWFNQAALIADLLDLPVGAEWGPPPMPMIEPDREGLAFARLMRAGVMTLPEVMRERGKDYAAHIAELAASNADLDRLGIWLDSDPRRTSAAGLTQERGTSAKPADATTTAAEGAAGLGGDA
jgi:capsid protein